MTVLIHFEIMSSSKTSTRDLKLLPPPTPRELIVFKYYNTVRENLAYVY